MEANEVIKFQPNIPVILTLKFDGTKPCKSKINDEDQFMLSAEGGKLAFLSPYANSKLEAAGVKRGDTVSITRTVLKNGQRQTVDWVVAKVAVEKVEADPRPAVATVAPAAPVPDASASQPTAVTSTTNVARPTTQLENALFTAIMACKAAEAFSTAHGYPVKFDKDDVRTFATTVLIGDQKGAR